MARSTIGDVARHAGVSTATVSRVLTGSERVSESLRAKVLAAASSLDYTVNAAARALRRDRTSTIGMVVPDLSNPFFTLLVDGVERGVQELGLSLHLCSSSGDPAIEAGRIRSLRQSNVEVLIVTPAHVEQSGEVLREVAQAIPVIQLDQYADGVASDWVGLDERHGMDLVVEHLVDQGVRSLGYVGGVTTDSSARERYLAAESAAGEHGLDFGASRHHLGAVSVAWGVEAAHRLVSAGSLPDAVICSADVIALGLLQGFDDLGVSVPGDVLVTGYDDIPLVAHPRLSITTVRQPVDQIAATAVAVLADILESGDGHRPERTSVRPELVVRTSSQRTRA